MTAREEADASPPAGHLGRYGCLYLSLAIHGALLWLAPAALSVVAGSSVAASERQQVATSLQRTRVAELQRHVGQLDAVKRQMEKSLSLPAGKAAAMPQDAAALAAQAQQLAADIAAMTRQEQAAALARLLEIPPQVAMQKILAQASPQVPPAAAAPADLPHPSDMAKRLAQARQALQDVQRQQAARRDGAAVAGAGATSVASRQGRDANGAIAGGAGAVGTGQGGNGRGRGNNGQQGERTGTVGQDDGEAGEKGTHGVIPLPDVVAGGSVGAAPNSYGRIPDMPAAARSLVHHRPVCGQ